MPGPILEILTVAAILALLWLFIWAGRRNG